MNMDRDIIYPIGSPHVHKALSLDAERPGIEADLVQNYIRWTDFLTGVTASHFEIAGEKYDTRVAASFADNFTAIELTGPEGKLNISLDIRVPGGPNRFGIPTMVGSNHRWTVKDRKLILSWQYNPELSSKGFYVIIRIENTDGKISFDSEKIELREGTGLYLTVKVIKVEEAFTFDGYGAYEEDFDQTDRRMERLIERNAEILGGKMKRSAISLGRKEDSWLSGEELLEKCHSENELYPMIMDKLYDMGRFYQIVDTGDIPPMWGQHNINTNLQVCAGNNTGLFEEMDVYFRYYESKFEDFRTNVRLLFNARGLLASVHCDPDSGLLYHFSRTYPHYCWTGCLGLIYNEFWGYYLVTGDRTFLSERVVPVLKEIARAILISNRKRGQQDDSAHGIIHRAFCSLRLKDREEFFQNMSQLINHGFVRRNLATAHFPYRGKFPDLQGAMPALLLEMCVYSEPGFVEFLPSLPDLYREGKIEGVWLYTFAKLEKLEWNSEALTAVIRSNKEQTIKFMLRNRISKFFINDTTAEDGAESKDYTFRAGEKVTIRIEPCDLR